MKRFYAIVGLILGFYVLSAMSIIGGNRISEGDPKTTNSPAPHYINLDGTLFLAIDTPVRLQLDDGDVVEFVFDDGSKKVSFHINEANQQVVKTTYASVFVLVPHDMALALRDKAIKKINIHSHYGDYVLTVNQHWIPHLYL